MMPYSLIRTPPETMLGPESGNRSCFRSIVSTLLRLAVVYSATAIIGLIVFIALHRSPIFAQTTILFYRGLLLSLVSALILAMILAAIRSIMRLDLPTAIGALVASISLNLCFLVIAPVTVDRSISVFLLTRIETQNGQLDRASLELQFRREYLGTMRQIDRRISEQAASGNIAVNDRGQISITPQGQAFLRFSRAVADSFHTDKRFVTPSAPAAPARQQFLTAVR